MHNLKGLVLLINGKYRYVQGVFFFREVEEVEVEGRDGRG
jgi:hypothetical protein